MLRYIFHAQIKKGEFRQFFAAFQKWDAIRRERGDAATRLFSPFVGRVNSVMLMADFDSLTAYQAESDRLADDPEVMAARREMTEAVDPAVGAHDELWEAENG